MVFWVERTSVAVRSQARLTTQGRSVLRESFSFAQTELCLALMRRVLIVIV